MATQSKKSKRGAQQTTAQIKQEIKQLVLQEIRSAAGQPAKGKGAGKRNRQARAAKKSANQFGPNGSGAGAVAATYNLPKALRNGAIKQDGFDSTFIRKCEFLGNVSGTIAFALSVAYAINPGLAATFPWLSSVAQSWERYRFRKLVFHYITRTGNATAGTVLFAPDYDSADAQPATEQIAADYTDADECPPYANPETGHYSFPLNCARMNAMVKEHFIRTGALAANLDIKTYDAANAYFFTVDSVDTAKWGKVWVEYEVDLFTPQLPSAGAAAISGGLVTSGGTLTAANPLGTTPTLDASAVGVSIASAGAASVVTLQTPGDYLVSAYFTGTSVGGVPNLAAGSGATVTTSATVGVTPLINNAAGTNGSITWLVTTTAANANVTLTINTFTVGTLCQVRVASTPSGSQA
jgi:hypothetical protein